MTEPTLNDFANAANDLYAEPTEQHFYAVCNMARDVLALSSRRWDEGYQFGRIEREAEITKLRDLTDELFAALTAALFLAPHKSTVRAALDEAVENIRPKWRRPAPDVAPAPGHPLPPACPLCDAKAGQEHTQACPRIRPTRWACAAPLA